MVCQNRERYHLHDLMWYLYLATHASRRSIPPHEFVVLLHNMWPVDLHKSFVWFAPASSFILRLNSTVGGDQGNRFVVIPRDNGHPFLLLHHGINRFSASLGKTFLIFKLTTSQTECSYKVDLSWKKLESQCWRGKKNLCSFGLMGEFHTAQTTTVPPW